MKQYSILIFQLLLLCQVALAQEAEYEIAQVFGTVRTISGRYLLKGDRLKSSDLDIIAKLTLNDALFLKDIKNNSSFRYGFNPSKQKDTLEIWAGPLNEFDVGMFSSPGNNHAPISSSGPVSVAPTKSEKPVAKNEYDYKVVKVKGIVTRSSTGIALAPGMTISRSELLIFTSADNQLIVNNSNNESFIVHKDKYTKQFKLDKSLMPLPSGVRPAQYSTEGSITKTSEITRFFNKHDRILLLYGKFSVFTDESIYQLNPSDYFFIEYNNNGELVTKKLLIEGNSISFIENDVLNTISLPLNEISLPIRLYYFSKKYNNVLRINSFELISVNEVQITQEALVLLESYSAYSESDRKIKILNYLEQVYGHPDQVQFEAWYQNLLVLESRK